MKTLSGIIGFVVIVLALSFAVTNRQIATISLWPFGLVEAPLYLLTLGTLFFGMLVGAVITWFSLLPDRFAARGLRRDLASLKDKVSDLQQTVIPPQNADPLLAAPKSKRRFWESDL